MEKKESKISNVEWGLVISALFMMDLLQWGLILLLVGLAINEFIDMFVAMSLGLYLFLRGETDIKQVAVLVTGWFGEAASDGGLPLWGLVGLSILALSKSEKVLGQVSGGNAIESVVEKTK